MTGRRGCKVGMLSLGCPRNLTDSESILGNLIRKGHRIVDMDKADIGIINTCSFIKDAKVESVDAILDLIDLKKEGRLKKIVVAGCLVERYREQLRKELPEVDAFVGRVSLNHTTSRFAITPGHYAYMKICEGCINNCSYCIIPRIKGSFTSLEMNSVLRKVDEFDRQKISELNIIGQDIAGYGLDLYGARKLPELLRKVARRSRHIGWLRLLYLYPHPVIEEILDLIRDEPRFCKYIDLPIQHINHRLLTLMARKTSKKEILTLINKIKKKIPHAAIRTSLIVGFPSETEAEFKELLKFIGEMRFERLGAFIYSREEGTKAHDFKKQIPYKVKLERLSAVMSMQQKISAEFNATFLGKDMDVLIDEKEGDLYLGRSQFDAPEVDGAVYVKSEKVLKPGDFVKVKITDTMEYDLVGEAA